MSEKLTFRAEFEFQGTADELGKVIAGLNKLPGRLVVGKIPLPFPYPGGWPIPPMRFLSKEMLAGISKERPAFARQLLSGINGGIRDPHLHLEDQVVILDREMFSQVVGKAAASIAQEVAVGASYQGMIGALRELNEMTQSQPHL